MKVGACFAVALLSGGAVPAAAADRPPARVQAGRPLTDAEFARLLLRFQSTLDRWRAAQGLPGATAAFVLPDGRMGKVASGMADVERHVAMTPDTRMMSGSTGKTFVGALSLKLAQEGRWSLDDKLSKYLGDRPWFGRLPNAQQLTIRLLLQHRSGLENYYDNPEFFALLDRMRSTDPSLQTLTRQRIIEFALDRPARFAPGSSYYYTDIGFMLVGEAMEAATGRTYYDLLREKILDPLGLALTDPSNRRCLPGLAQGYAPKPNPLIPRPLMVGPDGCLVYDPSLEYTGGGLVTNAGDLARWAWDLYSGRAVTPAGTTEILAPAAGMSAAERAGFRIYGLGSGESRLGGRLGPQDGHSGYIMGYQSAMRYYPLHGFAIAFQVNSEAGVWNSDGTMADGDDLDRLDKALAEVVLDAGVTGR